MLDYQAETQPIIEAIVVKTIAHPSIGQRKLGTQVSVIRPDGPSEDPADSLR